MEAVQVMQYVELDGGMPVAHYRIAYYRYTKHVTVMLVLKTVFRDQDSPTCYMNSTWATEAG